MKPKTLTLIIILIIVVAGGYYLINNKEILNNVWSMGKTTDSAEQENNKYAKEIVKDSNLNYAFSPTKILPEMPFKNIFSSIVNDDEVDISISKSDYEWGVFILEKNENVYKGERKAAPVYTDDVLYLSIKSKQDWDERVEDARNGVEYFKVGSMELKQKTFNGLVWDYYDFFDGYDGGYLRTYFIEKDGYVISFAIANEVIEDNSDISLIPKIKFLQKLNLEPWK